MQFEGKFQRETDFAESKESKLQVKLNVTKDFRGRLKFLLYFNIRGREVRQQIEVGKLRGC